MLQFYLVIIYFYLTDKMALRPDEMAWRAWTTGRNLQTPA